LRAKLRLPAHDALMLLGMAGDMRPGQSIFTASLNVSYYLTLLSPPDELAIDMMPPRC